MRLACVIDSVNYNGGAHSATWAMMDALSQCGINIEVFTAYEPTDNVKRRLGNYTMHVISDAFPRVGFRHFIQAVCRRARLGWMPNWALDPMGYWRGMLSQYDSVVVIGENSDFRNLVGSVDGPEKIVFIHTDYAAWRCATRYGRVCSRWDRFIYRRYDRIAIVGQINADRFCRMFPRFKDKVVPFYNIFHFAGARRIVKKGNALFKIVSVSRLNWGPPKKTELSIAIASKLKKKGLSFDWTVLGDGPEDEVAKLESYAKSLRVEDCFHMVGHVSNPISVVETADITTLLSAYEGVSNAIYESLLCGVPVIATNVGGAAEQIEDGKTGRIVSLDEDEIANVLAMVIRDRSIVARWKNNLAGYKYDNEEVIKTYLRLLDYEG